jgi:hypothetical protein
MPPNDGLWPDDRQRRSNIDRQFGQVDVIAFKYDIFPCALANDRAGNVFLTAFAKCRWQIPGLYPETGGQQLAIARDICDQLHVVADDVFESQETAQALIVAVYIPQHAVPLMSRMMSICRK